MKRQQSGFTLIELIAVIVVLGILAATALPKFTDTSGQARLSAVDGLRAAIIGSYTMVYAQSILDGQTQLAGGNVMVSGVAVSTVWGYPSVAGIQTVVVLAGDAYTLTVSADDVLYEYGQPALSGCEIEYAESTAANTPPVLTIDVSQC